jgi:hypothetical protein
MFVFNEGTGGGGGDPARDAALQVERRNFLRRLLACPTALPLRTLVAHDPLQSPACLAPPAQRVSHVRRQARLAELLVACMGDAALEATLAKLH